MDNVRGSLSGLKHGIKHLLERKKPKTDKTLPDGRGERSYSLGPSARPGSQAAMDRNREREGNGSNTDAGTSEPGVALSENKSKWNSTASASAKLLLRGVRDSVDAFPPLKSIAGGLCFILENYERTKANTRAIESLAPRIDALAERLCKPIPEGDSDEQERRNRLEQKLYHVRGDLLPLEKQGMVEGFFKSTKNSGKLGGLVEDIRDAMMEYQTSIQQGIYDKSCQLIGSADLALLDRMHYTVNAGHRCGNRQGCLRGTRESVLSDIWDWFTSGQGQRVLWLNGLAGTGKSTIAQTFADIAFMDGKLGASFFCSRDFENRSDLQKIFPTLAFQLACQYPHFRVLKRHPDAGHESLCSQMEGLLVGPLRATQTTTLIIIDALDECKDKEPASAILSILSRYVDQIPTVKFFITGRPEPRIRSGFRLESLAPITEVLKLHEVKPEVVDGDIEWFFRTQLTSLAKNRSDIDLTEDWPSPSDIRVLCKKAAGFFIYASTVVKFVASAADLPSERLSLITSLPESTEEGRFGVDQLYTQILQQAFSDIHLSSNQRYLQFQNVVGAVLILFNPLSIKDLSDLLGCNPPYIQNTTRFLHSLLHVPGNIEEPIRIFHKSFPDFLTDPNRCKDGKFVIMPAGCHVEILLACLGLMEKRLRRNICNLGDYAILSEVKALSTYKKDHIGGGLEYACKFWTKHLLEIPGDNPHVGKVQKAIEKFFKVYLLYWIEVLAITQNLDVGVHAMNDIQQWCNLVGVISEWANDGQRFLLEHFDTIYNSPSHTYHSALPLSPSSSWLYKHYSMEASCMVRAVKGVSVGWGVCSRTTLLGSPTWSLSCYNNRIVVGSRPGDIIILSAVTGSQSAVLSGHTDQVNCVVFSPDGTSLVSGSDDTTVKFWDVQTGGIINTFFGHINNVLSVSISANCATIASGSDDLTTHLWNIQTGDCCHTIQQQEYIRCVIFSPKDPQHLISISNLKIWQWDGNGCQIRSPFDGIHAAFSSDGAQFVSCCRKTITVYNSNSGGIVTEFQVANDVCRCSFSPDNRLVAAVAGITAYCWDITTSEPQLVETLIGHMQLITSLIFSSSTTLISASNDGLVKFWQIGVHSTDLPRFNLPPASLHSAPIISVTVQSKEGIAITSDSDGSINCWDISTSVCKTSFQTPTKNSQKRDIRLVNGRVVLVWYADDEICMWDTESGEMLQRVDVSWSGVDNLKISEDGLRVIGLCAPSILAWSLQTGKVVGRMEIEYFGYSGSLIVDESKVWAHWPESNYKGWDFSIKDSTPVELSNTSTPPCSNWLWDPEHVGIKHLATGEVVFQLSGRFSSPVTVQCNGSYLVAGYQTGEVLILDLTNVK